LHELLDALQIMEKAFRVQYAQYMAGNRVRFQARAAQRRHNAKLNQYMQQHMVDQHGDMESVRLFLTL